MSAGLRLGIAVTTYNRKSLVIRLIDHIEKLTITPFDLVICDDGSTDGTVDAVKNRGVSVIEGQNRGIAWNKNRGLYYLSAFMKCDVILLLDDDVRPDTWGWDLEWIHAALDFGHMNFATGPVKKTLLHGKCVACDPGVARALSGQCIAFRRDVLAIVGYMDTRFGKYGHEHTELTLRCLRSGFGGLFLREGEVKNALFFVITGGLVGEMAVSSVDQESLRINSDVFAQVRKEGVYRPAWRNEDERELITTECAIAYGLLPRGGKYESNVFDEAQYISANPDVGKSKFKALDHYLQFGRAEGRSLRPR